MFLRVALETQPAIYFPSHRSGHRHGDRPGHWPGHWPGHRPSHRPSHRRSHPKSIDNFQAKSKPVTNTQISQQKYVATYSWFLIFFPQSPEGPELIIGQCHMGYFPFWARCLLYSPSILIVWMLFHGTICFGEALKMYDFATQSQNWMPK